MLVRTGLRTAFVLLASALLIEGCAGRHGSSAVPPANALAMVRSVSPASVQPPPMARTPILPSSVMSSVRHTRNAFHPVGWTQLPGGASAVAASPDGSIWVISSQGSGADRSIWHYVNGTWTNVPGAAMRISVGPDNMPWVVNSAGGIYSYTGSTWNARFGGASDISVAPDGSVYVISNVGNSQYGRGIWHFTGGPSNGVWTQLPGAAVRVAASWDAATYPNGIAPGGAYVVNAVNDIYYWNPGPGFVAVPGKATQVVPVTSGGGLYALGNVLYEDGSSPISFDDLSTGSWTQQPGAAVSIATNAGNVYAVGAAGGIYKSPAVAYWPAKASMSIAQGSPAGGVIGNVFYVVGGYGSGPTDYQLATIEAYDPSANSWTTKTAMPTARYGIGIGVVSNVLYAVGGGTSGVSGSTALTTVEAYDPATNAWATKAPMPTARSYPAVAVVGNIVYVIGGMNAASHAVNTVEAYDTSMNTWATKTSLPAVLTSAGAGVVGNMIYVIGGETAGSALPTAVQVYDSAMNTWTAKASMPAGRLAPAVGVLNNIVYAAGGIDSATTFNFNNTVDAYDPVANTWTTAPHAPTARYGAAAGVINNVMYVAGGTGGTAGSTMAVTTLEAFSP